MDHQDLTASVWDDVISPSSQSQYNLNQTLPDVLHNQFDDLAINQNIFSSNRAESDHEEEQNDSNEVAENATIDDSTDIIHDTDNPVQYDAVQQSILEQKEQLRKEQNIKHKSQLMSELTHNDSKEESFDESFITPQKVKPVSGSLFNDKDSPLPVSNDAKMTSPVKKLNFKNSQLYKTPRPRKFGSKLIVKHLQPPQSSPEFSADDALGPLGVEDEASPEKVSVAQDLVKEADAPLYELPNQQKPVVPAPSEIELEDPSKPAPKPVNYIEINVGDPMKVGDITNAHIVYTIKTKNKNPEVFKLIPETVTVTRRYKDFRWIYHQLQHNYPGRIIPPPPTKQTYIGRFNENFIENRRLSLEKMLTKISNNAILNQDRDFIIFLSSEDFSSESIERERINGTDSSEFIDHDGDESIIADDMPTTSSTNGFMSSLFSISTKIDDPDEYFIKKKAYIEELESSLKNFYRAIEIIGQQRNELIGIYDEICNTLDEMSKIEISKMMGELLAAFVDIQTKLRDNLDQINLQEQLTLGFTIEEYLRIINSIKTIFETRINIYQQYYNANQELIKKQSQLLKFQNKYKQQPEKIELLNFEIDKLQQRTTAYETKFQSISDTAKEEISKFELERINDFRNSVEIFIESSIESQKEAIELYETFYERQNLANV